MPRHQRPVGDLDRVPRAVPAQDHVAIAGRDQRPSGRHAIPRFRLFDFDPARAVEPISERPREPFGHVLNDQERRRIVRQRLEHIAKGLRAAGGGADGDDPFRRPRGRLFP
jgi:hypothetical protein